MDADVAGDVVVYIIQHLVEGLVGCWRKEHAAVERGDGGTALLHAYVTVIEQRKDVVADTVVKAILLNQLCIFDVQNTGSSKDRINLQFRTEQLNHLPERFVLNCEVQKNCGTGRRT